MSSLPAENSAFAAPSGLIDIGAGDYWDEARRPLASLLFLAPLLVGYEAAVISLSGTAGLRNGADAWMRGWLVGLGLQFPWVLPAIVSLTLLVWHWLKRDAAAFQVSTFLGMLGESLLFALVLILSGQALHSLMGEPIPTATIAQWRISPMQMRVISSVGAGLYEEFLFRLLLVPCLLAIALPVVRKATPAAVIAVAVSSIIFSAAHYLPADASAVSLVAYGEALESVWHQPTLWYGFLFRGLAGAAFGTLFVLRGFGVTVGSHAFYDVLVGFMASLTA
ncbi:CAAX amino terminal protease self- immunity [Caulifigura coniformis]|uniref:CAAX amino terminal protease self-immunity n=1 Tax=Caulifigura coniformis TaxID=2527983 RepID=A0A517SKH7_9PLAN|nr:CPBP family glutamic-type intramembrane protease [Caulifigura coniformis]QDT56627.1 CAAX amino terminal protease self- immunity [Caulifigura coniformis]